MRKHYLSAPLPFVGQKRMFAKEFIKVLSQFPDGTLFVDLFGGSGLLSHIAKCQKPHSKVVYNDFDNYRQRLQKIPRTNILLSELRSIVKDFPRHKLIPEKIKNRIIECISHEEKEYGFVDYITISSSLLFSMKYVLSLDKLKKETLYNNIRLTDYPLCEDYLNGLEVTSCDYRCLYEQYKDTPGVVFLIDPPYLSTEVGTYNMYWKLADYLDVLNMLHGHSFIYFTSNKSSIIDLCDWMGKNPTIGNPFDGCQRVDFNAHMNHTAKYTDIMLYKKQPQIEYNKTA